MNEIKTIKPTEKPGSDYFCLYNKTTGDKYLKDYLPLFNIDDYYIYKYTRHQKEVSIKEFLEFKYAGYVFFKKDKYNKKHIEKWIEYIIDMGGIMYLVKPLPPFSPNKIIIK